MTPERDTPGCRASACAAPRNSPVRGPIVSKPRSARQIRSTTYRTTPKTASITAISHGCPSLSSIVLSNKAPASAPGIVPITSAHASFSSTEPIERRRIDANHAFT